LDGFKTINDSLGHGVGDEVLVAVARCLETCMRPSDTVARLGGDEFAVLLEAADLELATGVADRILQVLTEPLNVAGRQLFVNASIGITLGGEGRDADVLLRDADVAMYSAKAQGKARYDAAAPGFILARPMDPDGIEALLSGAVDPATLTTTRVTTPTLTDDGLGAQAAAK
jgi:diguanylate cyclase (GGDEF)-like protein